MYVSVNVCTVFITVCVSNILQKTLSGRPWMKLSNYTTRAPAHCPVGEAGKTFSGGKPNVYHAMLVYYYVTADILVE